MFYPNCHIIILEKSISTKCQKETILKPKESQNKYGLI